MIITVCALLLLAYVFDVTSSKTRIPSVILLLTLGWLVKKVTVFLNIPIPNLESTLPLIGTIGLILIVLDGSLELELKKENYPLIGKSALVAIVPMLVLSFGIAQVIYYFDAAISFKDSLANAIPISVISSAVAISSAKNLKSSQKEFITYESSLSDVFGVILFNFITLHDEIDVSSFGYFLLDMLIILLISFAATIGLAFLLSRIKHKVKFAPIIILVILIYYISKVYHLPALIFILLFGLLVGNLDELKHYKFVEKLQPELFSKEIQKFRELTSEFTFLIRTLFFILFGFLIKTEELLNQETFVWSLSITVSIFVVRALVLKIVKLDLNPLLYISPRGLITILLFLSIPTSQTSALVNNSLIIQIVILTTLFLMFGLMFFRTKVDA
ncbi:MAG: cation:proton antiporter [Flavobacterium sp.]|nr:cation:proton antiporter [Flavobacterium sp.]